MPNPNEHHAPLDLLRMFINTGTDHVVLGLPEQRVSMLHVPDLLRSECEVVVVQRPQLCESAEQPGEAARPVRRSLPVPAHLGEQLQNEFLQVLYTAHCAQIRSVCLVHTERRRQTSLRGRTQCCSLINHTGCYVKINTSLPTVEFWIAPRGEKTVVITVQPVPSCFRFHNNRGGKQIRSALESCQYMKLLKRFSSHASD